jgi:hypothetical protein
MRKLSVSQYVAREGERFKWFLEGIGIFVRGTA